MNRSDLRVPCEHGAYDPHDWVIDGFGHTRICEGGRPVSLADLEALGEKVWLCIERDSQGTAISNLPGGPNHCYFTGRYHKGKARHLADCGERILLPIPDLLEAK